MTSTRPPRLWIAVCLIALAPFATGDDRDLILNIAPGGYPPYTMAPEDAPPKGIIIDLAEDFARKHGLSLKLTEVPTKRVESFLLEGRIHATPNAIEWTPNPDRFLFTAPILHTYDVLVTRRDRPLSATTLEELNGVRVITQLGFKYPGLDERVAEGAVERVDVQHEWEVLHRVRHGQGIDAGVMDNRVARWLIRQHFDRTDFRLYPLNFPQTAYRLKFGPHWDAHVRALNRHLTKLQDNGRLQQWITRYE